MSEKQWTVSSIPHDSLHMIQQVELVDSASANTHGVSDWPPFGSLAFNLLGLKCMINHAGISYFALPLNLGSPMPWPRNLTLRTRSMALSTFWSGTAVPRSNSATTPVDVLHFVARSFCVILGSIFCRAALIASPTTLPTVFGLMMSSLRSTFVRCWPSGPLPIYMGPVR